jgi:nitroimidazol reductase NimA-like FMN-containing flavoprotein (pyridoxamine 5'-phosphate oxidase superfamily)
MDALSMSRAEREEFLAETHVGILSVAEQGGRAPLSVPIWYRYEPGGAVHFVTGGNSRKAALLRKAARATLVAQNETLPYKYVTVEGPVTFGREFDRAREIDEVAYRYLGRELGETYLRSAADDYAAADNVLVSITPERWGSADFGKLGLG